MFYRVCRSFIMPDRIALPLDQLRAALGDRLQENVSLAAYTSARIGGPVDVIVTVRTADELALAAQIVWKANVPHVLLGAGSNVLVSDRGFRGVVILNRAKEINFVEGDQPYVIAESGATLTNIARMSALKGLGGFEWAATVPGTLGGAIYGNAGAHGGDMAHNLISVDLLTDRGRETWMVDRMQYEYRSSVLKKIRTRAMILSGKIALINSDAQTVNDKINQFSAHRKRTQPPGASMGSMFKNPIGDYAGRLIEAAGLKGMRIGNAEISSVHGNFFINIGETKAADVRALIELAQKTVEEKLGIKLELEIELIGE
jgi:UDP-N-acetylmuramate dehydrogenase